MTRLHSFVSRSSLYTQCRSALTLMLIAARCYHKHGLCHCVVSVCLSVHPSHSCILSKRMNIFSNFPRHSSFLCTKHCGNIPTETTLTGPSNAGGVGKNRDSRPVSVCIACYITLHYIKSYLECPKSLRTARTLYEIKGVMWEYSYEGKHIEKR